MARKPLAITAVASVDSSTLARNRALSPDLPEPSGSGHLAIVGGGPSVLEHIETLRHWSGDIWAVNGAYQFLRSHGIEATFFTICPNPGTPSLSDLAKGAKRAVIAAHCEPELFATLKDSEVFKVVCDLPGPTSAVSATYVGLKAGYERFTLFGCEGSYGEVQYAYDHETHPHTLRIECGGKHYLTKPEFVLQAEQLAEVILALPQFYSEQSGGLLRALVKNNMEYDVTHVSRSMTIKRTTLDTADLDGQ